MVTVAHRNMSYEEEEKILSEFSKQAEQGKIVEVSQIKKAYDKAVGHETKPTQIYALLKRHKWTKKMPRSRHPKKAKDGVIEASKKKLNV